MAGLSQVALDIGWGRVEKSCDEVGEDGLMYSSSTSGSTLKTAPAKVSRYLDSV